MESKQKHAGKINLKHVLITHSSYPLAIPLPSYSLCVVSCHMANLRGKLCEVSGRLCRKFTNGNEVAVRSPDADVSVKPSAADGDLKPVSGSSHYVKRGVNEFTAFDRTREVTPLPGQTLGPRGKSLVSY